MSLTTALNTSMRGLNVAQEAIAIAANNTANKNTPGYIAQKAVQASIVTGGEGQGAEIVGISASVSASLLESMRDKMSDLGKANILDDYFNNLQSLYGQPGSGNSLTDEIDQFFSAFQNLSASPDTASLKLAAVTAAKNIASKISNISTELHNLRVDADRNIASTVSSINNFINNINSLNLEIVDFEPSSSGYVNIQGQQSQNLLKLAELIDVSSLTDTDGKMSILTKGGTSLLDSTGQFQLNHSAAPSIQSFVNDNTLSAITITKVGSSSVNTTTDLVTSGKSSATTTTLLSGQLKGLVELRDTDITKMLDQLDQLAAQLENAVNAIHNDGSSFPPPSSLTGTTLVADTDSIGFSGSVMIAVVDSDGTPVLSPYGDETNYRPLTLDLSSLDSGNGAGEPTMQTIVDEINDYFGPAQNRAVVGNLRDVVLTSETNAITDAGTGTFQLEFDNISAEGSTVVLQAITLIDPIDSSTNVVALPATTSYTVAAGDRKKSGMDFTVDFSVDNNRASYTVRVRVQVTDASGNVSSADIDYTVSDSVTGIINDRYRAAAVANVSGTSSFMAAPTSNRFATARILDANGNPTAAGEKGFLNITTASGKNYGIAINELDSKETGLSTTASADVTSRGFSHYFGLNNLFTDNYGTSGSAYNMAVRSDIQNNPGLLATGELALSKQPTDTTKAAYTYELSSGNTAILVNMVDLDATSISFASSGTLPTISTTLSGYSGDVISFAATMAFAMSGDQRTAELSFEGWLKTFQEVAGVNTDEELANVLEFESNYRAAAQMISTISDLFQTLLDTFR